MTDNQPTILVKKADGTFARVLLSDLKKKPVSPPPVIVELVKTEEQPQQPPKPVVVDKPVETEAKAKTWIKKDQAVAVPVSLAPKKTTEPVAVKEKPADFKSLLEDSDLTAPDANAKTSVTRDSDVDKVIKRLSFTVLASFSGRLRSVIQLRLKDVRGANETKDMVLRSIKDGGLGLTEAQAGELEKICEEQAGVPLVEVSENLPQKFVEPMVPANTTPFNSFIHEEEHHKAIAPLHNDVPEFTISSALKPKPVIQDVVSKTIEMGPIEEIKFFRLIDWRRLANNPTEAANRLKQKFINLKDESVLLFIEAAQVWRESPMYQEYLDTVDSAFNKHLHLDMVANDKEKITLEEIKALVNMEKELGI